MLLVLKEESSSIFAQRFAHCHSPLLGVRPHHWATAAGAMPAQQVMQQICLLCCTNTPSHPFVS